MTTKTPHAEVPAVLLNDNEIADGIVRAVALNRPTKRNALDTRTLIQLREALFAADADPRVRAVVLHASGPAFCAGGDTSEFSSDQVDDILERAHIMADVLALPQSISAPVIVAADGAALGAGAALALSGDIIIAGADFYLGYPELPRGTLPSLVMPSAIARCGAQLAFDLVTTGRRLGTAEAHARGIVGRVAQTDTFAEALELASTYATFDADTVSATKNLFYQQAALPLGAALVRGLESMSPSFQPTA